MNRRRFLQVIGAGGLVAAGLGLAACTQPNSRPGSAAKVTIGLTYTPDIQFAPFYVALEQGYFTDAGLDVTLRHHGANEQLFGAIQAGSEDVVYAGGAEVMQARSQGVPLVSLATYYRTYPVVLVVRDDSPIRAATDLRGHSVGVPGPFGETWFGLLALLKQAGLGQDEVQIQHIGFTQQAALTTGKVDAVMGYVNNDAVRLAAAGVPVRSLPITDGTPPLVSIGLATLNATLESRGDDLVRLQQAVARAVSDIINDPDAAVTLSQKHIPGFSGDQRRGALATLQATIALFGEQASFGRHDPATWESMADFLLEMELLAKPVPAADCFTTSIVPA